MKSTPAHAASTTEQASVGRRTLIAGVGYANLRDCSVGPILAARLAERDWPAGVEVEDYSFGAIDALHKLRAGGYDRAVFFGAMDRGDAPGTIRRYRFEGGHDPGTVQQHVAEAAQAVISLDTTLIVAGHFGALPSETMVFEVEPEDTNFGDGFTPAVQAAVEQLEEELGGIG